MQLYGRPCSVLLSKIYAAAVNLDLKANLQQQREGRGCEETTRPYLDLSE
jgi:hypothetical protein